MPQNRKAPPGPVLRAKAGTFPVQQAINQESRKELRKIGLGRFSEVGLTPQFHLSNPFFKHPDQSAPTLHSTPCVLCLSQCA